MSQIRDLLTNGGADELPRERLVKHGKRQLSKAELLALILGSGSRGNSALNTARHILKDLEYDLHKLARLSPLELKRYPGMGDARSMAVAAALELGRRKQLAPWEDAPQIRSSRDLYQIFHPILGDCRHEEFWVIYLNRANRELARERISQGGVSGTVVDVKILFKNGLDRLCSALAVCHNHPSGNLRPSEADRSLTTKVRDAARLLDMSLLDHIIIAGKGYYSFADEGLI